MKIQEQKISKFLDDLSSKNATPGGGVVAALSGVMAASLVEMVCNLTIGKKGYEDKADAIKKVLKDAQDIKKRLVILSDEDSKAFEKVMAAYKLDKEDVSRVGQIKKSLKYAIEVPLEVKKLTSGLVVLAEKMAKIGNKNATSDAKTAVHLAKASGKAAQENIRINKRALADLAGKR